MYNNFYLILSFIFSTSLVFGTISFLRKDSISYKADQLLNEARAYGVKIPDKKVVIHLVPNFILELNSCINCVGYCLAPKNSYINSILINQNYARSASSVELEQTLLHELGHCVWGLKHTLNMDDIMYPFQREFKNLEASKKLFFKSLLLKQSIKN